MKKINNTQRTPQGPYMNIRTLFYVALILNATSYAATQNGNVKLDFEFSGNTAPQGDSSKAGRLISATNFLGVAVDTAFLFSGEDGAAKIIAVATGLNHLCSGSTDVVLASDAKKGLLMTSNLLGMGASGFIIMAASGPAAQAAYIAKIVIQAATMIYNFLR